MHHPHKSTAEALHSNADDFRGVNGAVRNGGFELLMIDPAGQNPKVPLFGYRWARVRLSHATFAVGGCVCGDILYGRKTEKRQELFFQKALLAINCKKSILWKRHGHDVSVIGMTMSSGITVPFGWHKTYRMESATLSGF